MSDRKIFPGAPALLIKSFRKSFAQRSVLNNYFDSIFFSFVLFEEKIVSRVSGSILTCFKRLANFQCHVDIWFE